MATLIDTPVSANGPIPGATIRIAEGTIYIPPPDNNTVIHVIRSGYDSSLPQSVPQFSPRFDSVTISLIVTGNMLIEAFGGGKGWGFVELYEVGDGKWLRGQAVDHGDNENAKKTLAEYGFGHGTKHEPVWVALRKL
jgi:hypothetical protein